jgi:hypothetical protein
VVLETEDVMLIVRIMLLVKKTEKLNLNPSLVGICGLILDDLDST